MTATQAYEAIRAFEAHEHLELAQGLGRIHEAGTTVRAGAVVETRHAIRDVVKWAATTLEPHVAWEESWLYPQVEQLTGTTWSTSAARFDHGQIATSVARLRLDATEAEHSLTPAAADELRYHLFALEALLRSHIAREEKLLLPVFGEPQLPS